MRILLVVLLFGCHGSEPAKPDPPGATKWGSNTNQTVGACHVGVSNIWVRDGLGLSANFSIQEADGGERREFVKEGSVVVVCGETIRVVRIDIRTDHPGDVFIAK
jgi:hypothetical protein